MDRTRLIQLLRCPETMQPVHEASPSELADWNARIARTEIQTQNGQKREKSLSAGLIREDGRMLFPVENNIPVMLLEEALVLP